MSMIRQSLHTSIIGTLLLLILAVLGVSITNTDPAVVSTRILELVVYLLLTAFAVTFSVPLSYKSVSVAHAIGMMAFLSLDASVAPPMTIAIALGALLGVGLRGQLQVALRTRTIQRPTWRTAIFITARLTISFAIASSLYTDFFQAPLPLNADILRDYGTPLALYAMVYAGTYIMLFALELDIETQQPQVHHTLYENWQPLLILVTLPIPFAFIGGIVAHSDESVVIFTVVVVAVVLIIFGLYALNYSQQQLRRQLDEMRSISVATQAMRSNLELDSLLRTTYVQVSQLLDAENFTVALRPDGNDKMQYPLVIRDGEELQVSARDGKPSDNPLIEYVIRTHAPLLLQDNVRERALELGIQPPQRPVQSWLGVPIGTGDASLGAFVVLSYNSRRFDQDDLRLLNIIVASTSIALENAQLYRQKSTRAEQLATLNQVSALLTGTLAPDEVLDIIVSSASTITEAHAVGVYLMEDSDDSDERIPLRLVRSAGLTDSFRQTPPPPAMSKQLYNNKGGQLSPLVIDDIQRHDFKNRQLVARLSEERKRALIESPLVIGQTTLGVMTLYFNQPQHFANEQIDLIQAFGTQAAQAINNARTFASTDEALDQRIEQLYALAAMGRMLNATLGTQRIWDIVLSYATDATHAPRGAIILGDTADNLQVPAQRGYPDDMFSEPQFLQRGITGQVLQSGHTVRIGDIRSETNYLPLIPKSRSILLVPILKGRSVLGVILVEHDKLNAFSETDGHFVSQIANQAVIAANNTQLFNRVREARDNMAVMLNAMEEGIILIDTNGIVAQANPRIDLIDLSPDDIHSQAVETLLAHDDLPFTRRLGFAGKEGVRRLLADIKAGTWNGYTPHSYEIHPDDERGVRYIQRQIIPVRDDENTVMGALLVFYNKSEERELARAREMLSQMVVHDLRSPLTAVTTSLRLLEELVPDDDQLRPLVEKTTGSSRRAIRKVLARVDSLLDISKMENGEMSLEREPSSVPHMAQNVTQQLQPLADEMDVSLIIDAPSELPLIDVDSDKVERMLLNLLDNALKYSPDHSTVTIAAQLHNDANFLRVAVIDRGPGVPDEYKRRLFDQFVQVEGRKTVRRGVGLGLTFCKLVVEAHGGNIWVEDNPDGGSIFAATLPLAQVSASIEE